MNVILVILDSLRKDHVGCYGNDFIKTPNLDRLAEDGVMFTRGFPESLPTLPVRRAMHTGLRTFPCRDFQRKKGDPVTIPGWEPIPEHQLTMAEMFRQNGYRTALFSDTYHIFKPAMNYHRGFIVWEWIRGQELDPYRTPFETNIDIEDPGKLPCAQAYGCVGHSLSWSLSNMRDWRVEEDWFPPRTFGRAIDWLDRNRDDEKFLLVVDEFDPHEPWNSPEDILKLYFDTAGYSGRRIINTHGGPYKFRKGELEYTLAQYAGEATLCDKYLGRLLDKVKELELWDDTMVVVVSDHGHPIMDHGVMHKIPAYMYPELMDLVMIIRHPDGPVNTECDAYVGHHDILPTLLALTDLSTPMPLEGRNIWECVTEERIDTRTYVTSIFGDWVWCRDREYAFISDLDGGRARLYDVREDPEQHNDIAGEKKEICKRMYKRILSDAGGPLPRYDIRREGHAWYEYPDLTAPGAFIPVREQWKLELDK